jgi:hypothetical protein
MRVDVSAEADEDLRQLYTDYPEYASDKDRELVDSILYHLSSQVSFRIDKSEGDLVLTTLGVKKWNR